MSNWNLDVFYTSNEDFEKDLKTFEGKIEAFNKFKGNLNQFESFRDYILFDEQTTMDFYKLYAYAHLSS